MKRKTLLISLNRFTEPYPVFPLALAYLHGYLREQLPDHEFLLFDPLVHSKKTEAVVQQFNPDYILISLRNVDNIDSANRINFIHEYERCITQLRQLSKAIIIIGGSAFSIFPEQLFERLQPDFGITGEGEIPLAKLLQALDNEKIPDDIPGVVYAKNGKTIAQPPSLFLSSQQYAFHDDLIAYYWKHGGMLNLQTKRGCVYNCVYCTYPTIDSLVRCHDERAVVDTVETLYKTYGISYIFFTDSVFNMFPEFNTRFAEELIRRNMPDFHWGAYFSPAHITKEQLALYQRSGLSHVEWGTESFSDTVLESYGKPFHFEDIARTSQFCRELELYHAHFLILGGIGETEQTLAETFYNARFLPNTLFFPFIGMRIYPHTQLWNIAVDQHKISKDNTLLDTVFYFAEGVNLSLAHLRMLARNSNSRWVFSEEEDSAAINRLRNLQKKGPLWEYLIRHT